MTGFVVFGGMLVALIATVVYAAVRRGYDPLAEAGETDLDQLLEALRELEFDYRTHKLDESDYARERGRLERAALAARGGRACPACGAIPPPEARFCAECGGAVLTVD